MSTFIPMQGHESDEKQFAECTLLMPMFSVGRVGCLATDSLIATYGLELIGYIRDPNVSPAVGNDALALSEKQLNGRIHLSMEVHLSSERRLVVIQQRAPVHKRGRHDFADHMVDLIAKFQFPRVVFLSSCHASRRIDSQLSGPQFRYFVTKVDSDLNVIAQQLHFPAFEKVSLEDQPTVRTTVFTPMQQVPVGASSPSFSSADYDDLDLDSQYPDISLQRIQRPSDPSPASPDAIAGSHVLRLIYEKAKARSIAALGLVAFATEGSGAEEGLALASIADALLDAIRGVEYMPKDFKTPIAWHSLFDEPISEGMYL